MARDVRNYRLFKEIYIEIILLDVLLLYLTL